MFSHMFSYQLGTCLHNVGPIPLGYGDAWMMWHSFIGLSKIKTVYISTTTHTLFSFSVKSTCPNFKVGTDS